MLLTSEAEAAKTGVASLPAREDGARAGGHGGDPTRTCSALAGAAPPPWPKAQVLAQLRRAARGAVGGAAPAELAAAGGGVDYKSRHASGMGGAGRRGQPGPGVRGGSRE